MRGGAEFLRTREPDFDQNGGARGGEGQVRQLSLCVEAMNPSCGGGRNYYNTVVSVLIVSAF